MSRLIAIPLVLAATALTARALPIMQLPAQDTLARRVAAVGSGTVRFSFRPRSGVCGDGRTFIAERDPSGRGYNQYWGSTSFGDISRGNAIDRCEPGNAYVVLDVRRGVVTQVETFVGPLRVSASTDLGIVQPQEAADYLLSLGRLGGDITSPAFLGAGIADGARITPTTLRYAREAGLDPDVRESALKWSARAAQRENAIAQVLETARAVAQTERDPLDVRERAIRVLGEMPGGSPVVRSLYASLGVSELRERAIRVVAEAQDADAAAWLRGIINNPNEEVDLRSRAIRVLAEEIGDTRTLHQVYPQLQSSELREQVVRSIGEHGTRDDIALLRAIFLDANEQNDVRERAVRVLGELGFTSDLQAAFDRVDNQDLQERIVRVVSEHGTRADLDWTEQIARNPKVGADVRERAVKILAESGVPSERLGRLYDQVNDVDLQDRLLRLLGERGDAAAIAKLNQVARDDGNPDLRERAVRSLGRSPVRK